MKRIIISLLVLALAAGGLPGWASLAEAGNKVSVVTTIFPIYDWVREIVGDVGEIDVSLLLDSGVDLHSFQPTAQDIMKTATCDVFIYVGGKSDEWVEDALRTAVNPDMKTVNLLEALGGDAKLEETVEGMEAEDTAEDAGEIEYDEHIWLSLRNAEKLIPVIASALIAAAPESTEAFVANADAYVARLDALDRAYADAVESAAMDTLLFADRFPFRYLADDYGLHYYAAFSGCSAESEASFETIAFLSGKVDALGLPAILTIEGDNHRIAETVLNSARTKDAVVLAMDSLQGTTGEDAGKGVTYLSVMEANLEVLKRALNP